jgi:hypothetical protein
MEQYRITAICCAPPDRSGAAHTTNLLGHLQVNVKCDEPPMREIYERIWQSASVVV